MNENFTKFGRSGCILNLNTNKLILTKTSNNIQYNLRLYSQFLKQSTFKNIYNFSAPKTYEFNRNDELYNFDMEYIYGKTFESFCLESNVSEIISFFENIILFLSDNLKNAINTNINFESFETKILKLKNEIKYDLSIYFNFLLNNPIDKILIGKNHGDFTLSNIIFSDKYYLIDFLDNLYETPLIDLVKIRQDSFHNFYLNLLNNKYTAKLKICLDFLDKLLCENFFEYIESKTFIWLSIFNQIRILPYLKNKNEINAVILNLKFYEYYMSRSW